MSTDVSSAMSPVSHARAVVLLSLSCLWAETAEVRYADVTQAARLSFRHANSPTPNKYLIETMGGGAAVLDFDHDGWLDVFFVNGARLAYPQPDGTPLDKSDPRFWNRLFRNNRDGTFTDVTEKAGLQGSGYGMAVATGDYDNDGFTDLVVTTYGGALLYRNNGNGTFTDRTRQAGLATEGWTSCAGFVDYDHDGLLDLFVCRYLDWNFTAGARFCGVQRPNGRSYCHPDEFKPVPNYLFRNHGDGTFRDVSVSSGIGTKAGKALGVAFADFDRDGRIDIYVANDSYPQFLFRNRGNGRFEEVATLAGAAYNEDGQVFAGMGTDFADLDDDGFPDILTTALPYQYYVFFRNNGRGAFTDASSRSGLAGITRLFGGWGMRVLDYDNDGRKDDDDLPAEPAEIDLSVAGLPAGRVLLQHYRVDAEHSNAYEAWKKMGSPQAPTAGQYRQLERAGQLQLLGSPEWRTAANGRIGIRFQLPRQGVSLIALSW